MVKIVKRGEDIINNRLTGHMPTSVSEREKAGREEEEEKEEDRENKKAPGMMLMLHLVFTFQAGKSCNIQTEKQTISSSSWGNWEHWVATKPPCASSHSISLSPSACLSVFLPHVRGRNNIEISCTAEKRRGVGGRAKRRWRGGGWAGVQSLKISQTDGRKGWATAAQQEHTFDFSYFCCFFHNVWSLPYKLMTKTLLQLRHKKTRRFCHGNFPSRLPARLLHVKSTLISKLFMGLRVTA